MNNNQMFDHKRMPPRDALGHHCHPDIDLFCNGDESPLRVEDFRKAGWDLSHLYLEYDATAVEISDRCGEGDPNVSDWCPERDGWYRAGIWDTEDGPIAVFVRPSKESP